MPQPGPCVSACLSVCLCLCLCLYTIAYSGLYVHAWPSIGSFDQTAQDRPRCMMVWRFAMFCARDPALAIFGCMDSRVEGGSSRHFVWCSRLSRSLLTENGLSCDGIGRRQPAHLQHRASTSHGRRTNNTEDNACAQQHAIKSVSTSEFVQPQLVQCRRARYDEFICHSHTHA
jgi:hypothetical protein